MSPGLNFGATCTVFRDGAVPGAPGARRGTHGAKIRPKTRRRIYHFTPPKVCPVVCSHHPYRKEMEHSRYGRCLCDSSGPTSYLRWGPPPGSRQDPGRTNGQAGGGGQNPGPHRGLNFDPHSSPGHFFAQDLVRSPGAAPKTLRAGGLRRTNRRPVQNQLGKRPARGEGFTNRTSC